MNRADALVLKVTVENQQALAGMAQVSKATQDTASKSKDSLQAMTTGWNGMSGAMTRAGIAGAAIVGTFYLIDREMARMQRISNISTGFRTLTNRVGETSESMLGPLRRATRGAVADLDLMQQTNAAIILGLPVTSQKMAELADISTKLGRAMGVDAKTSLESLIIGIGRQSRLWLDNIGIVVDADKAYAEYAKTLGKTADALTEAERKQAFMNEALKQGKTAARNLADEGPRLSDIWATSTTALQNHLARLRDEFNNTFNLAYQRRKAMESQGQSPGAVDSADPIQESPAFWNKAISDATIAKLGVSGGLFDQIERAVELTSAQLVLIKKDNEAAEKRLETERKKTAEYNKQIELLMWAQSQDLGGIGGFGQSPFAGRTGDFGGSLFGGLGSTEFGEAARTYNEATESLVQYAGAVTSVDDALSFMLDKQVELGDWSSLFVQQNQETINALFEQASAAEWVATKYDLLRGAMYSVSDAMLNWAMTGELSLKGLVNAVARSTFSILSALAIEATIRGFMEVAKATAAAASFNYVGAALHAAAAKQFFATAGKAGIGAGAALAVVAFTRPDDRDRSSGPSAGRTIDPRTGRPTDTVAPGSSQNITIILEGDGFIYDTPEEVARKIEDAMRRARGRSGSN